MLVLPNWPRLLDSPSLSHFTSTRASCFLVHSWLCYGAVRRVAPSWPFPGRQHLRAAAAGNGERPVQ